LTPAVVKYKNMETKSGTQFSTLNSAGINDPEGPEKYNNTEVKP
jgi:hypothetical protein